MLGLARMSQELAGDYGVLLSFNTTDVENLIMFIVALYFKTKASNP